MTCLKQAVLLQREENRAMEERVSDLGTQCRKLEANLTVVGDCLSEIERDSTLSEVTSEALQKAQRYVRDSLNLPTRLVKMQNIGIWLHTSAFKSSVRYLH